MQLVTALTNWLWYPKLHPLHTRDAELSVLIPARDEEYNIGAILGDLRAQTIDVSEIIVYDDQSTDRTAAIVLEHAGQDSRIRLISSTGLPAGWLGKNHACHQLSQLAGGTHLLFIDADVRLAPDALSKALHHLKTGRYGLVSIFPSQIMESMGERLTVPIMHYILLSLLPLALISRTRFSSLAAANGQFMLFRGDVYQQLRPHQQMKDCQAEDIAIARYLKQHRHRISCLSGWQSVRCRMYHSGKEAVQGFAKNIAYFFGGSTLAMLAFTMSVSFGWLPVLHVWGVGALAGYVAVWYAVHLICVAASGQPIKKSVFFAVPITIYMNWIVYISLLNRYKKVQVWKGRNIYS